MTGFVVEDPKNWLTKSQKDKVKAWFRDHYEEGDYRPLLDRIHYQDTTHQYTAVHLEPDPSLPGYRIQFGIVEENNLRERLRAKLRLKTAGRACVQGKGEDWKMYHRLLQSPAIKMIPVERLDMILPNPDGVRKQRSNYEQFQKICPDPTLKEYFGLCLES